MDNHISLTHIQDRLVLCMEQELVRAHQRATKSYTPISVCSVLLERLLPRNFEPVSGGRGFKNGIDEGSKKNDE